MKSFLKVFKNPHIEIETPAWYGWNNQNSALLDIWVQEIKCWKLGNCGFTFLPLLFWRHIELRYNKDWKRLCVGVGIFSFFISFKK